MSGAQAAAEATEATAEILVESYLDLVFEGEDEVGDLSFWQKWEQLLYTSDPSERW